ncbi:MAG: phage Gp19/Gp15/Gp42 family protein [Paludibacteraceae bacterium]|nr:phage Gp19/Gp15/Gp42 family protein [Paludibacteraceae bacterium]
MANYADINDVIALWRPLSTDEIAKVESLLPIVSNCLRYEAEKVGKDLDEMIAEDSALVFVAKSVTVDVVKRYINDNIDRVSMSQMSESVGGYTVSGTYLSAGGGLFIKKSELARLGLRKQRFGVIDFYGN